MIEGSLLVPLVSIVFLLIISAFFSGSETGLTGISRSRIYKLRKEGNKRARQVLLLRHNKDSLIGTILLGNNAVNIGASALATAIAIKHFGEDGILYVTIVMTLVVLIFSEILPKTYAFNNAEKVALNVAPILIPLVKLLSPVTKALQVIVSFLTKVFGLKGADSEEDGSSMEALRGAIQMHHDSGAMVKDDRYMLDSILDLKETEVGEIMIHRRNIHTIDIATDPKEIVKMAQDSKYTRIPLWEKRQDNIIGILHNRDLLKLAILKVNALTREDIRSILMPAWFIPETTSLKSQLKAFLNKKNHFALVVNEYGDLQGMVTLEDILEEIVGQIEDEQDKKVEEMPSIKKDKDGSYIVRGTVTIRDLNRALDWNLPDTEAATVAGLIIHGAKNIPNKGQKFRFYGYNFEILGRKRNQITKIKASKSKRKKKVVKKRS